MRYGMQIDHSQPGKALTSAWVEPHPRRAGRFMVRGRTEDGSHVLHLGPDNDGWETRIAALSFAHRSTREGVRVTEFPA